MPYILPPIMPLCTGITPLRANISPNMSVTLYKTRVMALFLPHGLS
jgi:hypothetical protein